MNSKPWLLPLFLAGTLGAIYFLPTAGQVAQAAVDMKLPPMSGGWELRGQVPSELELKALAKDTEFSKAICVRRRAGEWDFRGFDTWDRVDLSVVLSGHDLNNSIHRPERCMPTQGHRILSSNDVLLKLANGREFTVRRLLSTKIDKASAESKDYDSYQCLTYYFFVGHERVMHDHLARTLVDMKDRLVNGVDQRWAYASASMGFGKVPWIAVEIAEKEADEKLREFLTEFAEKQIVWSQIPL